MMMLTSIALQAPHAQTELVAATPVSAAMLQAVVQKMSVSPIAMQKHPAVSTQSQLVRHAL
jgi:hypothetical protein